MWRRRFRRHIAFVGSWRRGLNRRASRRNQNIRQPILPSTALGRNQISGLMGAARSPPSAISFLTQNVIGMNGYSTIVATQIQADAQPFWADPDDHGWNPLNPPAGQERSPRRSDPDHAVAGLPRFAPGSTMRLAALNSSSRLQPLGVKNTMNCLGSSPYSLLEQIDHNHRSTSRLCCNKIGAQKTRSQTTISL